MEESIKDLHSLKEKEKLGEVKLKEEDGKNEKADYQVYVKHKKLNPCDSFGALYVSKSLGFLNRDNGLRVKCLKMIKSKRFENCIILLIVANSIVLAMTDYRYVDKEGIPRSEHSWRNKLVEATEIPFTICFAMECFIKIIAMGLFMGNRTYLRDSWNKIDFVVVASSLIGIIPGVPNISALRTIRVLRPLRSLSVIPGMRRIVTSLLQAIPALFNVVLLQIFVFFVFGILGIQLFAGITQARCRITPFPVKLELNKSTSKVIWPPSDEYYNKVIQTPQDYRCLNVSNFNLEDDGPWSMSSSPWAVPQPCFWPEDPDDLFICTLAGSGNHECLSKSTCGSNYDAKGNARFNDPDVMKSALYVEDLNWGFTTFDNIAAAFLTIFQSITMEGWTDIMYQCQDAQQPLVVAVFFILLVVFGSFFLLNLTLAVICEEFSIDDEDEIQIEQKRRASQLISADASIIVKGRLPFLYDFVTNTYFSGFIIAIIILNTVVLAMDHHPMPESLSDVLEIINFSLSCLFFCEMILKILGIGLKRYVADRFNTFDMFIVVTSIFETLFVPPSFLSEASSSESGGALSALRTFRLFRIFKLARNWVSLRVLLATIVQTLSSIVNFGILLILFIYIYALIGIQFFANKFHFDDRGEVVQLGQPGYAEAEIPRGHFDDLLWSFVTIFQVLTGENWNTIMYDGWRAGGWMATIYFVSLVILGNFIVMNLFLAILLGNFEGNEELTNAGTPGDERKPTQCDDEEVEAAKVDPVLKSLPPKGSSLYIYHRTHPHRIACYKSIIHPKFDTIILVLIVISSIALAIDNPLYDPDSSLVEGLAYLDALLTILFTIEMGLKIVALGFCMHKGSYLRNSWNRLDFIIVISSLLMLIAQKNPAFKALRSLRALRTFRPLRMISRQPGLKLVVNALFESIPAVVNVAFVCVLFFLIFSIVGVNYFKGTFNACQGDVFDALGDEKQQFLVNPMAWADMNAVQHSWINATACSGSYPLVGAPTSRYICDCFEASWEAKISQNFDHVGNAMLTLFELSTTEGWVNVMYAAVDSTDIDMQPIRDFNVHWVWFFVAFMVVGSFFVMNLFVGVIIDNFNRMKATMGSNAFLTDEQKLWVSTQQVASRVRPIRLIKAPENRFRLMMFDIMQRPQFDVFIMGCIIFNTLLMACQYFGMSEGLSGAIGTLNDLLAIVYTTEAFIKLVATGELYFYDTWNRFDFSIVLGTGLGYIIEAATGTSLTSVAMIIRTIRIGRIARLIKTSKGLQQIISTLYVALPGLTNITSLLFLMLFIFAVMGVQIFSKIAFTGDVNQHAHFQSFFTAILFLLRATTGENWNGMMHSLAANPPGCVDDPPYQSNMCGFNDTEGCIPINGCGNKAIYIYMLSFTLLVTYVMLNLSIAVILEGFSDSSTDERELLEPRHMEKFQNTWAIFDRKATGFIETSDVVPFLESLDTPMGTKGLLLNRKEMTAFIVGMALPVYDGKLVAFTDAIQEIAKRILQEGNPSLDPSLLNSPEIRRQSTRKMQSGYNVETYFATVLIQKCVKRWLAAYRRQKQANIQLEKQQKAKQAKRLANKSMVTPG